MADSPAQAPKTPNRWWRWPLGVLSSLLLAVILVLVAQAVYVREDPDGFRSTLAKGVLLNGAVVAILGAVVATMLSKAAERRSRDAGDADKRLRLFRRMRDAHVRVTISQQILRARRDTDAYHEQMLVLQEVIKDMGEIREEVKVSRLYDRVDRGMIMTGIALLITYLNEGVSEYIDWCNTAPTPETPEARPNEEGSWLDVLVSNHDGDRPAPDRNANDPDSEGWEAPGRMPPEYEDGLERSKVIMRGYVYGSSPNDMADLRDWVERRSGQRKAAKTTLAPPSARAGVPLD